MSQSVARIAALALLASLAACGDEPPAVVPAAPRADAARPAPAMPSTAWAPQAPYSAVRLSPFDPVK